MRKLQVTEFPKRVYRQTDAQALLTGHYTEDEIRMRLVHLYNAAPHHGVEISLAACTRMALPALSLSIFSTGRPLQNLVDTFSGCTSAVWLSAAGLFYLPLLRLLSVSSLC